MLKTIVIHDLQFGSSGKGQIAGAIAQQWLPDTAVCAFGPNAGHSYYHTDGRKFVHTMLPIAALSPLCENILIGPGAVINLSSLIVEIVEAQDLLRGKTLHLHPQASILSLEHTNQEKMFVRIGSTMKGTAAAAIHKMSRDPNNNPTVGSRDNPYSILREFESALNNFGINLQLTENAYDEAIDKSSRLMIEGAQGHSLSIHGRFYPYCTSRDVSINQIFADCRVPYSRKAYVIGVARTFPIRVANRFDAAGNQIGTSGPCYPDQKELDWKTDLGREPELTTVTKLPRRIFDFSFEQIREAARLANPSAIALTFCDYLQNGAPDTGWPPYFPIRQLVTNIEAATNTPVRVLQYGPKISDMYELCNATVEKTPLRFLESI